MCISVINKCLSRDFDLQLDLGQPSRGQLSQDIGVGSSQECPRSRGGQMWTVFFEIEARMDSFPAVLRAPGRLRMYKFSVADHEG